MLIDELDDVIHTFEINLAAMKEMSNLFIDAARANDNLLGRLNGLSRFTTQTLSVREPTEQPQPQPEQGGLQKPWNEVFDDLDRQQAEGDRLAAATGYRPPATNGTIPPDLPTRIIPTRPQ